jgi:hypothetical protein
MHSVPMLAMKEPLLVNSPGGTMQTTNRCLPVSIVLRGVEFKITPVSKYWARFVKHLLAAEPPSVGRHNGD